MGRGTWKDFELFHHRGGRGSVTLWGDGSSQFPGLGGPPEKKHETCKNEDAGIYLIMFHFPKSDGLYRSKSPEFFQVPQLTHREKARNFSKSIAVYIKKVAKEIIKRRIHEHFVR